jgi:hypothetical protein
VLTGVGKCGGDGKGAQGWAEALRCGPICAGVGMQWFMLAGVGRGGLVWLGLSMCGRGDKGCGDA